MTQLTLTPFEVEEPVREAPYQAHSATSRMAAAGAQELAETLEGRVLQWFREHGPATDLQMMEALALNVSNGVPRRVALMQRGLVRDSGERAINPSGRQAVVWEAAGEGETFPQVLPRPRARRRAPSPTGRTGSFEVILFTRAEEEIPALRAEAEERLARALVAALQDGRQYRVWFPEASESRDEAGIAVVVRAVAVLQEPEACVVGEHCLTDPQDAAHFQESRLSDGSRAWVRVE